MAPIKLWVPSLGRHIHTDTDDIFPISKSFFVSINTEKYPNLVGKEMEKKVVFPILDKFPDILCVAVLHGRAQEPIYYRNKSEYLNGAKNEQ